MLTHQCYKNHLNVSLYSSAEVNPSSPSLCVFLEVSKVLCFPSCTSFKTLDSISGYKVSVRLYPPSNILKNYPSRRLQMKLLPKSLYVQESSNSRLFCSLWDLALHLNDYKFNTVIKSRFCLLSTYVPYVNLYVVLWCRFFSSCRDI